LKRLQDVAAKPLDPDQERLDATVHRFNIAFETLVKLLDTFLEERHRLGLAERGSSKFALLKAAYRQRLIEDEQTWIDILDARNTTSHEYDRDKAMALYESIKRYVPHLERLFSRMADS
jgi:nucleotidyltransferase substrate binding protein (TIGR01987 family)